VILAVALSLAVPNAAEFAAAHAAQCHEGLPARPRRIRCSEIVEEPTEFSCRYDLPVFGGKWKRYTAIVARDKNELVWLDGETRCAIEANSTFK
jgi:hypothetical protein